MWLERKKKSKDKSNVSLVKVTPNLDSHNKSKGTSNIFVENFGEIKTHENTKKEKAKSI